MSTGSRNRRLLAVTTTALQQGWCVDLFWQTYRGRDECVAFSVRSTDRSSLSERPWTDPDPDPLESGETLAPVTSQLLVGLRIASRIDTARPAVLRKIADLIEEAAGAPGYPRAAAHRRRAHADDVRRKAELVKPRVRRGTYTIYHYENVKRVYEQALAEQGLRGAPTKAVADHFHVPYTTANKWVARMAARFPDIERPNSGAPRAQRRKK